MVCCDVDSRGHTSSTATYAADANHSSTQPGVEPSVLPQASPQHAIRTTSFIAMAQRRPEAVLHSCPEACMPIIGQGTMKPSREHEGSQ